MLGTGTQIDPYIISTPQDLHDIRNNSTAYYELGNDIEMSNWGNWIPISTFNGILDGKGFVIQNLITNQTNQYTGFIGQSTNALIKNLGLVNVDVQSNNNYVGGLLARNNSTTIENCFVTGTVKLTSSTMFYNGGLVGISYGGVIENCYTNCIVSGGKQVGGLVGHSTSSTGKLTNCYSIGKVTGSANVGGFYGFTNTTSGYIPTYINNFFDYQTAGTSNYVYSGVTRKTTVEMKTQSTYTGWDFTNTWMMNNDYPTLKVFDKTPQANIQRIEVNSFSIPIQTTLSKSIKLTKNTESILSHLNTSVDREIKKILNVSTYTLPIITDVSKTFRSVRSSTQNVITFINPISAAVERKTKTFKSLISHIRPLKADISVLYHFNTKGANAYLSVIENPSRTFTKDNMSNVLHVENPSSTHIEMNQSNVLIITNPSSLEVME
jgi:The GLUG motif